MSSFPIRFQSLEWKRTDDRGDIAIVAADRDRQRFGDFDGLVGATIEVDSSLYVVRGVEAHAGQRPISKGEHIALLVRTADPSPSDSFFHRAGVALFGVQYVAPMAAMLRVEKNTIGKWASGKSRVPPNVWMEISTALHNRSLMDFEGMSNEAFELCLTGRPPSQTVTIRHSEVRPMGFLDLDSPAVGAELAEAFARKAPLSWPGAVLCPRTSDFVVLLREPMNTFVVAGMKSWVHEMLGQIATRNRHPSNAPNTFPIET